MQVHVTYDERASANALEFSSSRLVVGSSSANTPQFKVNVSANAKRITSEASIWQKYHT